MISMLICSHVDAEINFILSRAKNIASIKSDVDWDFIVCRSEEEIGSSLRERDCFNIIIMDLSFENGLDTVKLLRKSNPLSYIMLTAEKSQAPTEYVRHDILAAGLALRPLKARRFGEMLDENLDAYLKSFYADSSDVNFILDGKDGRQLIPYSSISYFEACEKKILLYTSKDQYSFYDTLDNLEKSLSDDFVRCHRSFIARKDKISKIMLSQGIMILNNGEMIPISRTYKSTIKELR